MATQRLEEQLECPVCLDRYERPKVLPCQHTFCLRCLRNLVQNGNVVRCPECRAEHPVPAAGVSGFPTNITLQRLLEANALPNVPSPTVRDRPANHVGQHFGDRSSQRVSNNYNRNPNRNADNNRNAASLSVLSPTAPPLDRQGTQPQQAYDVDLQLALQIAVEEENRIRENQLNRNVGAEDESRRRGNGLNAATNVEHDSRRSLANQENDKIRQYIHRVAGQILNNHKTNLSVFILIYIFITFSRFVAGAVKLSSDCELERKTAVYLFVKAILAALFWGALGLWTWKRMLAEALDNRFVEFYLILESLFSIIWFFVGTAWICGNFNSIHSQCPAYISNWNAHYINFALFLTVVDYIGFVVFLFYSGYTICENEGESEIG